MKQRFSAICTAISVILMLGSSVCVQAADLPEKTEADDPVKEEREAFWISQTDSVGSGEELCVFGEYEPEKALLKILSDDIRKKKKAGYDLGFIMIDLASGGGIACDPDRMFYSASTVKGIYAAALTKARPDVLEYEWDTLSDILIYSENEEYEYLWYTYGSDCIRQWAEDSGVSDVDWDTKMYVTYSARDLTKLWLHAFTYFETESGKKLAKLYESADMSVIRMVLGSRYRTRSKAGWIPKDWAMPTYNDAGIVYAGDRPYVICFLSDIPEERMGSAARIIMLLDLIHRREGRSAAGSPEKELTDAVLEAAKKTGSETNG